MSLSTLPGTDCTRPDLTVKGESLMTHPTSGVPRRSSARTKAFYNRVSDLRSDSWTELKYKGKKNYSASMAVGHLFVVMGDTLVF